ncbi:transposase [Streptomyces sp. NBC_01340]|uniref:transposase n=1 Tax=unclassified Streptomyces TaxID=2593676 RepID=UPI00225071AD|nr:MULTISPECIES: transposase [unclassified Streptomyces]MCX4454763.1 transposase [Streptomyces sp. NBC_01719]MCX4494123.1 transposase [Streptomyces sp. NBC_01728]WSI39186.1 transposase [Streptomyces sp. NBC_01340]
MHRHDAQAITHRVRRVQRLVNTRHHNMRAHQSQGRIHQAVAVTGIRRARYRGLQKTQLEHNFSAVALNLIRLDAWWNGHPLDRSRVSHLARLDLSLAA